MGGGAGLTFSAQTRIVREDSAFAMPETAIGLYPDVGASYILPRLKGYAGLYLAMTGVTIPARDMLELGLANCFIAQQNWDEQQQLCMHQEALPQSQDWQHLPQGLIARNAQKIDHCFSADSPQQIMQRLEKAGDFGISSLEMMSKRCPLSMAVAFHAYHKGKHLTLAQCFEMETKLSHAMILEPDFYEGVRALLIDKDQCPQWHYGSLDQISAEKIAQLFG